MAGPARVLVFAGSLRRESFNRKLARIAAAAARNAGGQVTELELADYPLPIYDGDVEAQSGIPAQAMRLKEVFLQHDALLIASPEYNSGISAFLKNVIDWVSRPVPGQPPLAAFSGKVTGLVSASTGVLGGIRGLVQVRSILSNIGVLVLPEQVSVPKAAEAFDAAGALRDPVQLDKVAKLAARLVTVAARLKA